MFNGLLNPAWHSRSIVRDPIMPKSSPSTSSARPSIAATLIMRNEARCIVRCLESIRPWVDRIVVLDTGSTDDSIALARRCGAQVHEIAWPGDFSAARNHVLDLANADWNLMIDADEWLLSGGEEIARWCAGAPRLGALCIHNSFDQPGSDAGTGPAQTARSWITRLLPRGVRYQGRIHEQPHSPLPRDRIDLHFGHDGYAAGRVHIKAARNTPLLLLDLADRPNDPYTLYQLGKDAEGREAYREASDWYRRAFALTPDTAGWLHSLTMRHLHCMGQSGASEEAMELASDLMEKWQDSPDFFFVIGNLMLDRAVASPEQALSHWLPLATSAWERCLAIGERPDLEGSVEGRGSHLARHNLDIIATQLKAFAA